MVKWFSARCFSGVLHYTQNSQQRTYTHRPVNSEPPKITHRHSSARQKGGQHQHAHAAAKNTNPHKASGVPASHGESHGKSCGWSMAGNQHGESAFGKFSWPLSALVRKVPILGIPQDITLLPSPKKTTTTSAPRKKPWLKNRLKQGKHSLGLWGENLLGHGGEISGELKTGSGSPKNIFNLARFAIGYYINYSWQ